MNGITSINAANPQRTFKAKPGNRKQVHEFIDKSNNFDMEILHIDRSLEEIGEIDKRKVLLSLKCPFVGKIIEKGKAIIEHITTVLKPGKPKENEYEKFIKEAVKEGKIDSDHAGTMLTIIAPEKFHK